MPVNDLQGTYPTSNAVGYAGMQAEGQLVRDVASRVVETAAVAFGLAVGRGTAVDSCKLGGTGFEGIVIADKTQDADQVAVGEIAGVMRKGTIWVTASTVVAVGDAASFTAATGVLGTGLATAITGGRFETAGGIGALVKLYLG